MAAAPLKYVVAGEAVGAIVAGAAFLVWTGIAGSLLALPATPPTWAIMRVVAVLLLVLGAILWASRHYVPHTPAAVRALAFAHAAGAGILLLQQISIWHSRSGALLALIPLALAVRYAQYAWGWGVPQAGSQLAAGA
jgi:hypothetical protein